MDISVVIAVYNGEEFIEKALSSCHHFEYVKEIILVDDGSKDNSLKIALECQNKYPKLKVFQHENCENKGAGASWNLAIKKSQSNWISFLGIDDVFLENRFDKEIELHQKKIEFDGVYGGMGVHYYSKDAQYKFQKLFNTNLTTVKKHIEPSKLKFLLLQMSKNNGGYFSLNSLTVKKELLLKAGLLNVKLRLHQDTDLIIKLSCLGDLISGIIEKPISSRGVHDNNRITSNAYGFPSRLLMYKELLDWFQKNYKDEFIIYKLKQDVLTYQFLNDNGKYSILSVFKYCFKNPKLFYNDRNFNLLINNSSASNKSKALLIRAKEKLILMLFNRKANLHSIYVNE